MSGQMEWRQGVPEQSGWYWVYWPHMYEMEPVQVFGGKRFEIQLAHDPGPERHGKGECREVWFQGPINVPEAPDV